MRFFRALLLVFSCVLIAVSGSQAQPRRVLDSLLAQLPMPKHDTARVRLYNVIGFRYSSLAPDTGLIYARKALALSQRIGWKRGIAHSYNIIGTCYVLQSDFPKGVEYLNRSLKLFGEIRDTSGLLKAIGNLGAVDIYQSNYVSGLEHNLLALKYAEALQDTGSIVINLCNIAAIHEYLKNFDKGLQYNFRALKLLHIRNDSPAIAITLGNIGNLYTDKKAYAEALRYQQQALALHERLGFESDAVRDMLNVGYIHGEQRQYVPALRMYYRALGYSRSRDFLPLRANTLNRLGDVLVEIALDSARGRRLTGMTAAERAAWNFSDNPKTIATTAVSYLQESIRVDSALQNMNSLQSSYKAMAKGLRLLGRYQEAFRSQEQYMRFRDSIFSLDNKAQIASLEMKREVELKDKQIELDRLAVAKKRNERVFFIAGILLLLVVAGIIFRNIRLKSAKELSENKLSAFQARMNPHFIFNSLNSIQSLVLSGETISSITYLSRFSKLMRQILDGSGRSKTLLQEELDMLRGYIELEQLRFDRFQFEIEVAPDINPGALEVPTMIIQPFVENAIIHGILPRRDAGLLRISFERRGSTIVCTVDDNGIGRKRSQELNAARSREHKSQGISIATNRLVLLGKRSAESAVQYIDKTEAGISSGTTVILQIPLL